jgi:hypothetical protein
MVQKHSFYNTGVPGAVDSPIYSMVTLDQDGGVSPNVWFAAGIRRQAPSEEMQDYLELVDEAEGSWTDILFGGWTNPLDYGSSWPFRWRLHIPLKGKPALYEQVLDELGIPKWTEREWTEGELSPVDAQRMATEGRTYWIGVIGDCIAVSEGNFSDDFAYYKVRRRGQPIVPNGDVRIINWPGQATMWLAPLEFGSLDPLEPWLIRHPFPVGSHFRPANKYASERVSWFIYGWSLRGYSTQVGGDAKAWTSSRPSWWPADTDWPPHGPPGEWPPYPPVDWPGYRIRGLDDLGVMQPWPPVDASGDPRPCPNPVDASGVGSAHIWGGGLDLLHWEVPDNPGYIQWRLEVEPCLYQVTAGGVVISDLNTYTTPFVEAVVVYQIPYITDNGVPALAQLAYVNSVRGGEQLASGRGSTFSVLADNFEKVDKPIRAGVAPANSVRLGALANIRIGWRHMVGNPGAAPGVRLITESVSKSRWLYGFWLVEKRPTDQFCEYLFTDLLGLMDLYQWDGGLLNFKYWNPYWAASYLLDSAGFGASWYDLEYFEDQRLYNDWDYSMGTTGGAILTDLFYRGQFKAAVWCDVTEGKIKSGCPYCRAKRYHPITGEPDYAAHQSGGWNSPGCLAVDILRAGATGIDIELTADQDYRLAANWDFSTELEARKGTLRAGEYADRITVIGQAFVGSSIILNWPDDDATGKGTYDPNTYIGHIISHVENDPGLKTWGEVNAKLLELVQKMGSQHLHLSYISMPMDVDVRPGWVVRCWGGTPKGANGKKFRIVEVFPQPDDGRVVMSAHEMV